MLNSSETDSSIEFRKVSSYCDKKIRKSSNINVESKKITDFYSNQSDIEKILTENKNLSNRLKELEAQKEKSDGKIVNNIKINSNLLQELLEIATSKKKLYSSNMKNYAVYIYLVGGNLLYSSISKELGLPSLSTVKSTLGKMESCTIEEGVPRFAGLKQYLMENGYPLLVFGSEDQTKIKEALKYDSRTNKIIGFAIPIEDNGLPSPDGVQFENINLFLLTIKKLPKASYINTIMMQPLKLNAVPYCFCIYGTKNSFTNEEVTSRWRFIKQGLSSIGITLIGT